MSVTTNTTPAPQSTDTDPLAGLPASYRTVYSDLQTRTEPASAPVIAVALGLGRSTAGKALAALEQRGLVHRTPGYYIGTNRTPDLWAVAAPAALVDPTPEVPKPAPALVPSVAAAQPATREVTTAEPEMHPIPATEPIALTPTHPERENATLTPVVGTTSDKGSVKHTEPNVPVPDDSTAPTPLPAQRTAPPLTVVPGGDSQRLAPGALRGLVIDHLTAHPSEAFTATRISRVIGRSSGAIANALVTLTRRGLAEEVTDRPRRYRLAPDSHSA
jgi:biotin operon repressor